MEQNDVEIYNSCERVRSFLSLNIGADAYIGRYKEAEKFVKLVCKGSEIDTLINDRKWTELFSNKVWINLLYAAENLSLMKGDKIREQLKIIATNFPGQTRGHIVSAIL